MNDATRRQIRAATLIWMASVALSRVAGLVREMVTARAAGATGLTDVFFTAFTIPDFINYLLAGSALSVTFIPIFTGYILRGEEDEGWRVFSSTLTVMCVGLSALLAVAWVLAKPLCQLAGSGFSPEQQVILVRYTRILLPAQIFFFIGGLAGAVQMARGRHHMPALAPIVYNLGIITGGLLGSASGGMAGFCWGALAGAFLGNGLLQLSGAAQVGLRFRPRIDLRHPAVREYFRLLFPFIIGQSIIVWDDWLVRYFGSHLPDASISWLNYAKKLALVLPAILGGAVASAVFPVLAQKAEGGQIGEMAETLGEGLRRALLLSGLGAALLIVLNREATLLAFRGHRFTVSDSLATGRALAVLALAVPAWVMQSLLPRGYYALRDTWTPTLLGTGVTLLAVPLYGWLARLGDRAGAGYLGLAAASAIAITTYGVLLNGVLGYKLRRRAPEARALLPAAFLVRGGTLLAVCFGVSFLLRQAVGGAWPEPTFGQALLRTVVVGLATLVLFGVGAGAMNLGNEAVLPALWTRRRRSPPRGGSS